MQEKITQLENRITELEARLDAFNAGYSIPREFDQAIRERLGNLQEVTDGGDGGAVNVSVYNSFDVEVPVVSGKRTLVLDGVKYDFLYQ